MDSPEGWDVVTKARLGIYYQTFNQISDITQYLEFIHSPSPPKNIYIYVK